MKDKERESELIVFCSITVSNNILYNLLNKACFPKGKGES
ncbi:hypothetical protein EMIT019CA3_50156 [Bacillus pseudomycoides]